MKNRYLEDNFKGDIRNCNKEILYQNKTAKNMKELVEQAIKDGVSLANSYLVSGDFRKADFEGGDFTNAALSRVNLEGANLNGANFLGAYMSGSNLQDAKGTNVNFEEARISHSIFRCSHFIESSFIRAQINYGSWFAGRGVRCNFYEANMINSFFRYTIFEGSNMDGTILTGSNIKNAHFYNARNLQGIVFDIDVMKKDFEDNLNYVKSFPKKKTDNIIYWPK